MGIPFIRFPRTGANICNPSGNRRILKSDQHGRIYLLPRHGQRLNGVRQVSVLSELTVGETAVLVALELPESVQNHLMHMGFVPDALVTVLRRAPAGDPTVYGIDGMEIALRRETATAIRVRPAATVVTAPVAIPDPEAAIPENLQLAEVAR